MTLAELKQLFIQDLSSIYEQDEIESIFSIYLEDKLNLKFQSDIELKNKVDLLNDLNELKKGKPVQHITEKAFFYNHFFYVNENTLIPRPETEELIELIQNDYTKEQHLKIIDLGTGSGCIPITLSKLFVNANVSALDISEKALEVANANSKNIGAHINFYQLDLLEDINLNQKFDVIISNPPYIRNLEKKEMHQNVLDFEPHLALFVDDDNALIFYERVIEFAKKHLEDNGTIYCEINQYLGKETEALFKKTFLNTKVIQDLSGNDRMLKSSYI